MSGIVAKAASKVQSRVAAIAAEDAVLTAFRSGADTVETPCVFWPDRGQEFRATGSLATGIESKWQCWFANPAFGIPERDSRCLHKGRSLILTDVQIYGNALYIGELEART